MRRRLPECRSHSRNRSATHRPGGCARATPGTGGWSDGSRCRMPDRGRAQCRSGSGWPASVQPRRAMRVRSGGVRQLEWVRIGIGSVAPSLVLRSPGSNTDRVAENRWRWRLRSTWPAGCSLRTAMPSAGFAPSPGRAVLIRVRRRGVLRRASPRRHPGHPPIAPLPPAMRHSRVRPSATGFRSSVPASSGGLKPLSPGQCPLRWASRCSR